jgi:hypothetical protein
VVLELGLVRGTELGRQRGVALVDEVEHGFATGNALVGAGTRRQRTEQIRENLLRIEAGRDRRQLLRVLEVHGVDRMQQAVALARRPAHRHLQAATSLARRHVSLQACRDHLIDGGERREALRRPLLFAAGQKPDDASLVLLALRAVHVQPLHDEELVLQGRERGEDGAGGWVGGRRPELLEHGAAWRVNAQEALRGPGGLSVRELLFAHDFEPGQRDGDAAGPAQHGSSVQLEFAHEIHSRTAGRVRNASDCVSASNISCTL